MYRSLVVTACDLVSTHVACVVGISKNISDIRSVPFENKGFVF